MWYLKPKLYSTNMIKRFSFQVPTTIAKFGQIFREINFEFKVPSKIQFRVKQLFHSVEITEIYCCHAFLAKIS